LLHARAAKYDRATALGVGEYVKASSAIEIAKHTLMSGEVILAIGTLTGLLARKIKTGVIPAHSLAFARHESAGRRR
jgi:hypothetical protein